MAARRRLGAAFRRTARHVQLNALVVSDHTFTRCPGCRTVFRVTPAQRALREGQVRCGHCRAVFDANDHMIALDERRSDEVEASDELGAGRPTITLRSADALQPVDVVVNEPRGPSETAAGESETTENEPAENEPAENEPAENEPAENEPAAPPVALVSEPIDVPVLDRAGRFEWKPRKPLRERPKALYGVAIALLLVALAAQALFEFRDALVAHAPFTRPLLQSACDLVRCSIGPLRDPAALSIDASDLQADPAHRGLLLLSATLRNRATYRVAYPDLELTLTDSSDQVVVRRTFGPADYIGGTSNPDAGFPGNGEKLVRLFIDASATSQAGYRLYLFYP